MASNAFHRISDLCLAEENCEPELISKLESALRTNPEVLNEKDDSYGRTLLHWAVCNERSVEFIKVLVEWNGDLVKTADAVGCLPIHFACSNYNVTVTKYLHSIYPESINIANKYGHYPLHFAVSSFQGTDVDREDLIRFLLKNDQGAVSKPTMCDGLALHIALRQSLEFVKLVFNTHPQAIHTRTSDGETPLDVCENLRYLIYTDDTRMFLEAQLEWERQAHEQTQPDGLGQLPIHTFVQSPNVHIGTVKLMISANPGSAMARDNTGFIPLHYACKFDHVDVVKFLLECNEDSIKEVNSSGNLALHIACLEGKCGVINCILERSYHGVSSRNKDGKLPVELLLCADVNRDSLEYIEAVNRLLRALPKVLRRLIAY